MSLEQILAAIPHRPPFLFLDEIVAWEERRIVCTKTFRVDEFFYAGHYPAYPLTPGVILCEAGMQAGAVLLSRQASAAASAGSEGLASKEGAAGRVPLATRLSDVRFKRMVRPGETIEIVVDLTERLADAWYLKAKVTCEGQVATRFEFACMLAEPT